LEEPEASSPSSDQIERLCEIAEEAARNHILSKVSKSEVSDLNITVEAGRREKNLIVDVDVEVRLSPLLKDLDAKRLVKEAVGVAFKSAAKFLREDQCHSKR